MNYTIYRSFTISQGMKFLLDYTVSWCTPHSTHSPLPALPTENRYCLLDGDKYIFDVTTPLANDNKKFYLLFQRTTWVVPLNHKAKDVYIRMLYVQVRRVGALASARRMTLEFFKACRSVRSGWPPTPFDSDTIRLRLSIVILIVVVVTPCDADFIGVKSLFDELIRHTFLFRLLLTTSTDFCYPCPQTV